MIPMKKNLFALMLALAMTLSLTACGGDNGAASSGTQQPSGSSQPSQSTPAGSSTPSTPAGPSTTPDAYVFVTNGASVVVNADMADVLAAIGEPQSYFEAESCAFEGLDKTYTYAGFVISTRPEGEKDFVNSILLTDDSVTTPEGAYIGCPKADVVAAYGEGNDLGALLTYTLGDCTMNFIITDEKVVSIEYLPA